MGARQELNKFHVLGSLGLAGFLGLASGSWTVFAVAGAVLIGAAFCTGQIRTKGGKRQHRRGNVE